jgi:acetylornithine deacetylase/succinyl-diaminopimelate desuccinylase-like protein
MRWRVWALSVVAVAGVLWVALSAADNPPAAIAREWRASHERQLLDEYFELLRIPNVSRDSANIKRNADALVRMMARRGLAPRLLEAREASPSVYGEWLTPGATHTYVFYAHYDGQPVDPTQWTHPPFDPVLASGRLDQGGRVIPLPEPGAHVDPNARIYARSASDDKAQIFAMLTAVDALRAAGVHPAANLKFIFEGEEEMDSIHLDRILTANKDLLKADLWIIGDGPVHQSGRQSVVFGARGIQKLEVTVYGPRTELHSGHFGNWAPNPAFLLASLLASMKDDAGRVAIDHFYDGVVPLSPAERQAIAGAPPIEAALMRELWLGHTEGAGRTLGELINLPSLNIRGLASGRVGTQAANVIPASATAALDLRLVKGIGHQQQVDRVIAHIRKQGYYVTLTEPDEQVRLMHPKVAWVAVDPGGYDAVRTPMDLPAAQQVVAAVQSAHAPVVLQPTSGGSTPLATIESVLGTHTIHVPIVNWDNNQHSANENVRVGNLWDGIEIEAALLMLR